MTRFTGILGMIEQSAGEKVAQRIAMSFGGTEISITTHKKSVLVRTVGLDAAAALERDLGRGKLLIPMGNLRGQRGRQAAAARMLTQGATQGQVAQTVDVHERTVRRVAEKMRDAKPLPLFPED